MGRLLPIRVRQAKGHFALILHGPQIMIDFGIHGPKAKTKEQIRQGKCVAHLARDLTEDPEGAQRVSRDQTAQPGPSPPGKATGTLPIQEQGVTGQGQAPAAPKGRGRSKRVLDRISRRFEFECGKSRQYEAQNPKRIAPKAA